METVCLASLWEQSLADKGWSENNVSVYHFYLAPTTISLYNMYINQFKEHCTFMGCTFPPTESGVIADFLHEMARNSVRPKSKLNCAIAAINAMYDAIGVTSPGRSSPIYNMTHALVRAYTQAPMKKSTVMPVKNFSHLFKSWNDNSKLCIKDLRLKAIALLSIAAMLRPSDIAPKTRTADGNVVFSTRQLDFQDDGSLKVLFFGIKNDTKRDGFEVHVQPHSCAKLDPVKTLRDYIERTDSVREPNDLPVFLGLRQPYKAIDSSTVANVLNEAIKLAGLDSQGYSAKSFRPTGATCAIANDFDPNVVRKIGRWKTESVFFYHYVHSKTPKVFTDKLIC